MSAVSDKGNVMKSMAHGMVAGVACLWLTTCVQAQIPEGEAWIGKKVVTKYAEAIRANKRVIFDGRSFRVFTVTAQDRGILTVSSDNIQGWIWETDVIPYDLAIDYYTREIQLNRANAPAYNWRGLLHQDAKREDQAIADFSAALKIDPKLRSALLNRGSSYFFKDENAKALADYSACLAIDPKDSVVLGWRGMTYRKLAKYPEAQADFEAAIKLDSANHRALNGLAWLWATCPDDKIRDGKKAVETALQAYKTIGKFDAGYLDTVAAAYAESGDFEQAVATQKGAIAAGSNDSHVMKQLKDHLSLFEAKKPVREK
jgi:tetratricopeptide (TPR) repeat protein